MSDFGDTEEKQAPALPAINADNWEDDEEPRPGGAQEKFWLRRAGRRALFKRPVPNMGPHHVNELIGARLAQAWDLSAPDVQLFLHKSSGWGALVYELPRPYLDFSNLPMAPAILEGTDRTTLLNDENVRCMPIFDGIINQQDRGGTHNSMVSEESPDDGPPRYRHWLTDHGYTFDGTQAVDQLQAAVQGSGDLGRYIEGNQGVVRGALEYAFGKWWPAVEPFCRIVAGYSAGHLENLLSQVPEGLATEFQIACIRERVLRGQTTLRTFMSEKGAAN